MKKWVWKGLLWAVLFYIVTIIIFPILEGESISAYKVVIGIPIWLVTGLSIGAFFNKETKKKKVRR